MTTIAMATTPAQNRLRDIADGLAAAVAVSLPWSTSATGILIGVWLIALIPTLRWDDVREMLGRPAAYLAIALFVFGLAGMLWAADVAWAERSRGLSGFVKLLALPLLFVQFQRSANGRWVLVGFIASCTIMLVISTLSGLWPGLPFLSWVKQPGVPRKDYIIQAALFVVSAFILLYIAYEALQKRAYTAAIGYAAWGSAFLLNIVFVVTSRTALLTVPVLFVLFAIRCFKWKGICGLLAIGVALAAVLWVSSENMRTRLGNLSGEIENYRLKNEQTSAGQRMEFWRKSVGFVIEAPVVGHGTGSTRSLFARVASSGDGPSSLISTNPHNQFLAVAVQLGLLGGALLIAMWISHALLFRGGGLTSWIGIVVVTQNIVGSLFNSHIFDFSNGWLYVIGVGVAGGIAMKQRDMAQRGRSEVRPPETAARA